MLQNMENPSVGVTCQQVEGNRTRAKGNNRGKCDDDLVERGDIAYVCARMYVTAKRPRNENCDIRAMLKRPQNCGRGA